MEQEIYVKYHTVMEPECDISKRIHLANIMRHAQQMGSEHLMSKNIDYNQMCRQGMVFLVAKMRIDIMRRPTFGEKIKLTTIPMVPKGVQFIRDTVFETMDGEKLANVSISWLLIDPNTRKILRPKVFDIYGFHMNPNDGEKITTYRVRRPDGVGVSHLRQIKYTDLDYNGHVNNAVYASIICDYLPLQIFMEKEISHFGIMYHREAIAGQIMELEVIRQENGTYYIHGDVCLNSCFEAEISFQ